jgi:hypothetical protein
MAARDDSPEQKRKHADYMRAYYHKNREKWLARLAARRADNPGEDAQKQHDWRENNRERWRARKRAYYANHREQELQQRARYNALHPEQQKQRGAAWYARNAKRIAEEGPAKWIANLDENRAKGRAQYAKHREKRLMANLAKKLAEQERQAGRPKPTTCDICEGTKRICFDHCHNSGLFRGWICHRCNALLGLSNDDATLLRKLANYLESHS